MRMLVCMILLRGKLPVISFADILSHDEFTKHQCKYTDIQASSCTPASTVLSGPWKHSSSVPAPFSAEYSVVSYFLYFCQLWLFVLITIY